MRTVRGLTIAALIGLAPISLWANEDPSLSSRWEAMLSHALAASPYARTSLENTKAASARDQALFHLADFLLDEWDTPRSDDRFRVPIAAWVPALDIGNLPRRARKVSTGLLVVTGTVNRKGKFENPRLLHSSGNRAIDEAALTVARCTLFRPAIDGGAYVPGIAALRVHLDPR